MADANKSKRQVAGSGVRTASTAALRTPWPLMLLVGAAILLLGYATGRLSTRGAQPAAKACQDPSPLRGAAETVGAQRAHGPKHGPKYRPVRRPFLVRPVELFEPTDEKAELRYQHQQAQEIMKLMRLNLSHQRALTRADSAEGIATSISAYMHGLADALIRTAPDLVDAMAGELEQAMCEPNTDPAELIAVSQLIARLPELANEKSFECVFKLHAEEDAVLWQALDAFNVTGMPKPQALLELAQTSTDPRTHKRLLDRAQREQAAAEALAHAGEPTPPDPYGPEGSDSNHSTTQR